MFWDGLIILIAVVLSVNSWKRGLSNSWRGLITIVLTTVVVQHIYKPFALWLSLHLRINHEGAVIAGYVILWLGLESLIGLLLNLFIRSSVRNPHFIDRALGILWGLAETCVIVTLPLMVVSSEPEMIQPSLDNKQVFVLPSFLRADNSLLVPGFKTLAKAALPIFGKYVVSTKEVEVKSNSSSQESSK